MCIRDRLSTRVRLARNLQGHAFGARARVNDRQAVLANFKEIFARSASLMKGTLLEMKDLGPRARRILLERRLVTSDLLGKTEGDPPAGTAVHFSHRDPLSVMVNEEDHFRIQGLLSGLNLSKAWSLVDSLDEELGQELPFAYHYEFGFLTSCPTNVGSGLRASVLVHLPGLVLTKEIGKVLQGLGQVGRTFRGLYGEGSEVIGNFFQVSNQTTLGKNEEETKNYIQEIIKSDLEEAGQEDVFRKIKKDFQAASISVEEKEIRDQMEKALLRAKEDFKK